MSYIYARNNQKGLPMKILLLGLIFSSALLASDFDMNDFYEIEKPFHYSHFTDNLVVKKETLSHNYKGFPFRFAHRDIYLEQGSNSKLDRYEFSITAISSINISKNSFEISQKITFQREQFHYFKSVQRVESQVLNFAKGDKLYADGRGKFLLYKRFQPTPLDFKFLWLSNDYQEYLATINSSLFQYQNNKVCFMDNFIEHSKFDCEKIAIKTISPWQYHSFHLILIDTINKSLELIKE